MNYGLILCKVIIDFLLEALDSITFHKIDYKTNEIFIFDNFLLSNIKLVILPTF